jgi:decaprenylphospho-beta-D-ribofuranose 2-oxidase
MAALLPPESVRRLSGFGMSQQADSYVFQPAGVNGIAPLFQLAREAGRKVAFRGAARSYGDANFASEEVVIDLSRFDDILSFDATDGVIEARPGATLEDIWLKTLPDGWWLPVVSGTMRTTLGGALAMNIHGKNNFMRGTFGEHVLEIDLLLASGAVRTLKPQDELFYAAIGGAGLLGAIVRIRLQLKRISSGNVRVEAVSCRNWEEQFSAFERFEGKTEYVVTWLDCFGRGDNEGRGILHAAQHDEGPPGEPSLSISSQILPTHIMGLFPKSSVWRVLKLLNHRAGMKFVNAAKQAAGRYREHGKVVHQSLAAYNFLLDYVPGWEKAYLPGGLIQCQYFVPKEGAKEIFSLLVRIQQEERLESYLAVMKRHRPDKFLLSHAVDGYSLALDFKVTSRNRNRLWKMAHRMNQAALEAGGRFYFAKDSTLDSVQAQAFLGEGLIKFRELKELYDPEGLFTNALAQRLALV